MAHGDVSEIEPRIGQDLRYPLVEEIAHAGKGESKEMLQKLVEQGYLERRFHCKIYKCPHDGTTSVRPRLSCPRCNSEELEKHVLIEHFSCGHVDLEENFLDGDRYVCPKDHKELHKVGVDYRKAGIAYKCSSCGNLSPLPVERWACNASDHVFSLEEAVVEDVYSYLFVGEKQDEAMRTFEYINPIANALEKHGYSVGTFADILGASGITHLVDIYAQRNLQGSKETAIVDILMGEEARPEAILGMYGVVLDTSPSKAVIVAVPSMSDEGRFYAQKLGMEAIEGKDIEEASQRLDLLIQNQGNGRAVVSTKTSENGPCRSPLTLPSHKIQVERIASFTSGFLF
jgi:hypothetical protein